MRITRPGMIVLTGVVSALWLLVTIRSAQADAIDGHWCHQDGRRLQITGPAIVTPAKTPTEGQYDRHHFSYVVPPGEPGAGTTINMTLMGEMTMVMKAGDTAEQTWNRCGPPISVRSGPQIG